MARKPSPKPGKAVAKAKTALPVAAAKKPPQKPAKAATKVALAKSKPAVAKPKAERGGAKTVSPELARGLFATLHAHHADAHCELDHDSPFQLIIATVLSAQSTDVMVNKLTPELFRRWPTPAALASADPAAVEDALKRIGMFRQKTRNIIGLAKQLVANHGSEVPKTLAELVKLPGVGRKTANVVLGVAFNAPEGVVVDTHVQRLSQRLGLTKNDEPSEIEQDLIKIFPRSDWDMLSHVLIFHGRRLCSAQRPACAACPVQNDCPSAFRAELVGRKPQRTRIR